MISFKPFKCAVEWKPLCQWNPQPGQTYISAHGNVVLILALGSAVEIGGDSSYRTGVIMNFLHDYRPVDLCIEVREKA